MTRLLQEDLLKDGTDQEQEQEEEQELPSTSEISGRESDCDPSSGNIKREETNSYSLGSNMSWEDLYDPSEVSSKQG